MPNDAREAERAWWPGDLAAAIGGSSAPAADDRLRSRASTPPMAGTQLEALRELALAKSPGRAKPVPILINFHEVEIGAVLVSH